MTDDELREMIRQELEAAAGPTAIHVQDVVRTAVQETLITLGMDASDPMSLQQDMHFVREMRETSEKLRSKGLLVLIGVLVTAALGAVWLGIKASMLGTP